MNGNKKETIQESTTEVLCSECNGSGYVEKIAYWNRPCDACYGEGYLTIVMLENNNAV